MKIGILGCGAMGTVMGAYMTKNGLDVELIDSYKEHVDVLNKNGAHKMFDTNQRMFLEMYKDMYTAKASMLQDLEKEKKTEVLMINGYVSSTGDKYNIDTPFNDTVVEIVTKIEKKLLPLSMDNLKYFNDKLFEYKYYQEKK